jgi:hypothetical protein
MTQFPEYEIPTVFQPQRNVRYSSRIDTTTRTMTNSIPISFDPIKGPLVGQLRAQGIMLDMNPLQRAHLQRDADEVARLLANHILTESEAGKARQRIFRIIKKHAKPL